MSALEQRQYEGEVRRAPEPGDARDAQRESKRRAYRPSYRVWTASGLRYGSLGLMVVVLLAGLWKPHPVHSLLLPAVALVPWWGIMRAGHRERWLYLYVTGIFVYTILRAFANEGGMMIRTDYVINFDRFLFFGHVPSVALQRDFFTPREIDWLDILTMGVHWSFFVVPHAAFAFVWFRRPVAAAKYVTALLLTLYLGLLLFWLLPTMPPWLASRQGDLFYAFRVMDFVTHGFEVGVYDSLYGTLAEPNPTAAMPSIHMALTFLVLLFAREFAPRWMWALVGYNLAMAFSLVYLGEHYVTDVMAGVAVATVAAVVARRLQRLPDARGRRGPTQDGSDGAPALDPGAARARVEA
ncbi:MAG: phosphatase PAP2 family protein [Chloroflexi bacterium]|nr:phosphatase PAP2 family protein [Chloroflexota bacterium]